MMKKVELNEHNSVGFGALIKHCNKMQPINYHAIHPGEWWECSECCKPVILVTESGWYEIGEKLQF